MMASTNPAVIPRNHRIEAVIRSAVDGDFAPFQAMRAALAYPFEERPESAAYRLPPAPEERVLRTFCGT